MIEVRIWIQEDGSLSREEIHGRAAIVAGTASTVYEGNIYKVAAGRVDMERSDMNELPGRASDLAEALGIFMRSDWEERFTAALRKGCEVERSFIHSFVRNPSEQVYPTDELRDAMPLHVEDRPEIFGYLCGVLKARSERSERSDNVPKIQ